MPYPTITVERLPILGKIRDCARRQGRKLSWSCNDRRPGLSWTRRKAVLCRYGETVESVLTQIASVRPKSRKGADRGRLQSLLPLCRPQCTRLPRSGFGCQALRVRPYRFAASCPGPVTYRLHDLAGSPAGNGGGGGQSVASGPLLKIKTRG